MGEAATFRSEDKVAIPAAIALHVAVVAVLLLQPDDPPETPMFPPSMSVSLAEDVSLASTAPDPVDESRVALAPVLSDEPAPAPAEPVVAAPEPAPPTPVTPRRSIAAAPKPARTPATPRREATPPAPAAKKGGGSRIGDDFLPGKGNNPTSEKTGAPAATFGRQERADLQSAITRQLRKNWEAPNGLEAEKLVSVVRWQLNQDGSLKGRPSCTTVASSITESNRPQSGLHCERAIRAVQLAAPFNLPEQFYSRWDDLEWQFDRRL